MKRTNFYLNLVNNHLSKKIKLFYAYGQMYVKTELGNETLFCGTEKQVYDYLVGVERLLSEQK
jgi:hypothetical protein